MTNVENLVMILKNLTRFAFISLVVFIVVGSTAACERSPRSSFGQERIDSAGTEIIVVEGEAKILEWDFRERWRVGGEDEGLTSFSQLSRWSVAAGTDRSIAVLDPLNFRIVVLDSVGEVVRTFGRQGGGPGELQGPSGIGRGSDGAHWVYDAGRREMVRFGEDGVALDHRRIGFPVWGGQVRSGTEGVYVEQYAAGADSIVRSVTRVLMDDEISLVTKTFPRPARVEVPGCGVSIPIGRLFEPVLRWDAEGSRVAVFVGPEYAVDVYDEGQHRFSLRMAAPLRPLNEELAVQNYPDGFRVGLPGGPCTVDAAAMVRAQGYAAHLPAVSQVRVTPEGEIWVQRGHLPGETPVIDVWAVDGNYVGILPAGSSLPIAFLEGQAVAVSEVDDRDVPRLVTLDLVRN